MPLLEFRRILLARKVPPAISRKTIAKNQKGNMIMLVSLPFLISKYKNTKLSATRSTASTIEVRIIALAAFAANIMVKPKLIRACYGPFGLFRRFAGTQGAVDAGHSPAAGLRRGVTGNIRYVSALHDAGRFVEFHR